MGQITPNIGAYIPDDGETNYGTSFAAAMVNIDQHDHTGGPNKGVPIPGSGLEDYSVTYNKLNSNVADTATGIGTEGAPFLNRLTILGLLKSIYQLAAGSGFISKDGAVAHARTLQAGAGITISNPAGIAGDPTIAAVTPMSGALVQSISSFDNTASTTATQISAASTPQITDGVQILTATITPSNASNVLQIIVNAGINAVESSVACLFKVGTANALSTQTGFGPLVVTYQMVAGVTTPIQFTVRAASNNVAPATVHINETILGPSPSFGGTMFSSIIIQEVKP